MDYPAISVLTPVYKRSHFLPLYVMNLKNQQYPHHLITIIIDDDTENDSERFITDLDKFKKQLAPIKVKYITGKPRRSIGEKRHFLIKECKDKIFAMVDSDDYYQKSYLTYSVETLVKNKLGAVGSDKMLFCMTDRDFEVYSINCGDRAIMIHEATIVATKKWYNASPKFAKNSQGEGKNLFDHNDKKVGITDINGIMVCIQHGENTVDKLQFATNDKKVNIEINEPFKEYLKKILK